MNETTSEKPGKTRALVSLTLWILAASFIAFSLAAQQRGPLPPPPAGTQPATPPQTAAGPVHPAASKSDSNITREPPALPVEEIVQRFGARELEFKKERDNYTYTQTFVIH